MAKCIVGHWVLSRVYCTVVYSVVCLPKVEDVLKYQECRHGCRVSGVFIKSVECRCVLIFVTAVCAVPGHRELNINLGTRVL